MTEEDPGWPISWRSLVWILLPAAGIRLRHQGNPLVLMRQIFLSFCNALVLFGVVLTLIHDPDGAPQDPPTTFVAIGLGMAVIGLVVESRLERSLDCAGDAALVGSYRTRFFLRIAVAESAALIGFVGYFLTYAWWPYPIGVAIAAVGFWRAAPTAGHLARDQERLSQTGCPRSLSRALQGLGG